MRNIELNPAISLSENGIAGFTLKDITGINDTGFRSESTPISGTYLRTQDFVILDIATLNRLDGPKHTVNISIPKGDIGYESYEFKYSSTVDGWFSITHIILPTYEWYKSLSNSQLSMAQQIFFVYNLAEESIYEIEIDSLYTKEESKVTIEYVLNSLVNQNLIGIAEDIFILGHLEKCFEDKIKYIYYNKLFSQCLYKNSDLESTFRDRDIVWMGLELLKYLVRECKYDEAERIIEGISGCNDFCTNKSNVPNAYSRIKCNCGK